MNPRNLTRKDRGKQQQIDSLLARISEVNRPKATELVTLLDNENKAIGTIQNKARALFELDRVLNGRPFHAVTGADLMHLMSSIRARQKRPNANTAGTLAANLKPLLKEILGVDDLPRELKRPLRAPTVRITKDEGVVLSDDDFNGLLLAAAQAPRKYRATFWTELVQAMLWTLWATGFRISELLSLNVGDVIFDDDVTCWFKLRPEAPEMGHGNHKRGARTIYTGECVGALRAWLAVHPAGTDRHAPLFTGTQDRTGYFRMPYDTADRVLEWLAKTSGLAARRAPHQPLNAHDFRHTFCTKKALLGWTEELDQAAGWVPGSRQRARYVHLTTEHTRKRVRRELGLEPTGHLVKREVADTTTKLARALARLMAEDEAKGATPAPRADQLP